MAISENGAVDHALQAPVSGRFSTVNPNQDPLVSDWYSRTFEEWSAAVQAYSSELASEDHHELADKLYSGLCNANTTTAGEAALKLRVIVHTLYTAGAVDNFPQPCAALSSLLADLERQDAAARFAARSSGSAEFAAKWRAFTGYDEAYKALPDDAEEETRDLVHGNRFDAFADLCRAKPQTANEAAAQLRIVLGQCDDILADRGSLPEAIGAGLGNVLLILERLAAGGR